MEAYKYLFHKETNPKGLIDEIKAKEYAASISRLVQQYIGAEKEISRYSSNSSINVLNDVINALIDFFKSNTHRYIMYVLSFISMDVLKVLKMLVKKNPKTYQYESAVLNLYLEILIDIRNRASINQKIQKYKKVLVAGDLEKYNQFCNYVNEICPLYECFPDKSSDYRFNKWRMDVSCTSFLLKEKGYDSARFVTVTLFSQFKEQFDILTNRLLRNVTWNLGNSKVVVAGGSVVAAMNMYSSYGSYLSYAWAKRLLSKQLPQVVIRYIFDLLQYNEFTFLHELKRGLQDKWLETDIDLFILSHDLNESKQLVHQIIDEITPCIQNAECRIVHTDHSVTIVAQNHRPIQIITMIQKTHQDLLLSFDLDSCAFVYDPTRKQVYTIERGVRAFNTCTNVIPSQMWSRCGTRAGKYHQRGFVPMKFHYPICQHNKICRNHKVINNNQDLPLSCNSHASFYKSICFPYRESVEKFDSYCKMKNLPFFSSFVDAHKYINDKIELIWSHNIDKCTWKTNCYQCNQPLPSAHIYPFHSLCEDCIEYNNERWVQWDLFNSNGRERNSKNALVTGGRSKLGYEIIVRLLNSGFHVITTSRFPLLTRAGFTSELNYDEWKDRLDIQAIDFTHNSSIEDLVKYVKSKFNRLDILINNAISINRKSTNYLNHLYTTEERMIEAIVYKNEELMEDSMINNDGYNINNNNNNNNNDINVDQILIKTMMEDIKIKDEPTTLENIIDIQKLNATTPIMLMTQLSSIMGGTNNQHYSCIVNVSSSDDLSKKHLKERELSEIEFHSYVAMARLQLNNFTKSLSVPYLAKRIYLCAVEPGWISKRIPLSNVSGPLTLRDGAARVLDPIYKRLLHISKDNGGVLFKNYKIVQL